MNENDEPIYEYIKGKGWSPSFERSFTGIKVHEGVKYRVTLYARPLKGKGRRFAHTSENIDDLESWFRVVRWWGVFEGIEAGFGPASIRTDGYECVTERLDS